MTLIETEKAVNRMTNKITINKYLFAGLLVLLLTGGVFGGYYYTNEHYEQKETKQFIKEQENLICGVRLQEGKIGDIKSDYFIFEQSAKKEDCMKFIDYKNLPDDTESFWLGF